jgi:hypothetical protein
MGQLANGIACGHLIINLTAAGNILDFLQAHIGYGREDNKLYADTV